MILRSLKLENIRSYTNERIEFPEGSILLSGDIGSGKSSILYGLEFALFGIMRSGLTGNALLRHGKNKGSVELIFEIGEIKYVVKRTLKRTKTSVGQDSGYIITNGKKFEGTPVELKAKIIGILGYPEELISRSKSLIFRYTVYTPQEDMKAILLEDKDTRLDTLRKVFGIDKYKSIKENTVLFIRELKRKKNELKIRLENYDQTKAEKKEKKEKKEVLNEEIKKSKAELDKVTEKLKEETEKLIFLEEETKEYQEKKKNLEIKETQLRSLKNRKEELSERIQKTENKIKDYKKKLEEYETITEKLSEEEIENEVNSLQDKLTEITKKSSAFSERKSSLKERIEEIEKEIGSSTSDSKESIVLKNRLSELKEKISRKENQNELLEGLLEKEKKASVLIEKYKVKIDESKNIIENIEDADICPTCGQEVDEKHRKEVIGKQEMKIESYKEKKSKTENLLDKVLKNISKVKNNLNKISDYESEYREKREKIIFLEESTKHLVNKQKELSVLYEKIEKLKKEVPEDTASLNKIIQHKKKKLSKIRENNMKFREKKNILGLKQEEKDNLMDLKEKIKKVNEEITELRKQRDNLNSLLEKYKKTEEDYLQQKKKVEEIKSKEKDIEIRLASLTQEKKSLEEQINEIKEKLEKLEKTKDKIKEISQLQNWFEDFFLKLMTTMEKHVMVSIHREFNSLLQEWFSILVDGLDISLDEEFSPLVIQDGYETSIENLSGGERTSVALAYRLALNKVINELIGKIRTKDIIILDEPTDGFSTEQLDKVRDVLGELNMKQTIIVSHEPKMESYVENIIRIAKTDNTSRIVS